MSTQSSRGDTLKRYLSLIQRNYPDLKIISHKLLDTGMNNDIVVINQELIFRFPRYVLGVNELKRESGILLRLRGKLPLPIPDPIYLNLDGEPGEVYTGYRMIQGEPLTQNMLPRSTEIQDALALQLGSFLHALHSLPVHEIIEHPEGYDPQLRWTDLYTRIRRGLYSYMRPDAREQISQSFEQFLNDPSSFDYIPAVVHGDFGPTNTLYDAVSKRVTGIIDFGSVHVGDPAEDFAALMGPFGYGLKFVLKALPMYGNIEQLLPRALFYTKTFALQEALFGHEQGDEECLKNGLAAYV